MGLLRLFVGCQPGLSVWKYDIYRADKLLLEISLRISNRFSLLRKCKWSEYRALCSYNIATYLVRLRAIKTMSKDFFYQGFLHSSIKYCPIHFQYEVFTTERLGLATTRQKNSKYRFDEIKLNNIFVQ